MLIYIARHYRSQKGRCTNGGREEVRCGDARDDGAGFHRLRQRGHCGRLGCTLGRRRPCRHFAGIRYLRPRDGIRDRLDNRLPHQPGRDHRHAGRGEDEGQGRWNIYWGAVRGCHHQRGPAIRRGLGDARLRIERQRPRSERLRRGRLAGGLHLDGVPGRGGRADLHLPPGHLRLDEQAGSCWLRGDTNRFRAGDDSHRGNPDNRDLREPGAQPRTGALRRRDGARAALALLGGAARGCGIGRAGVEVRAGIERVKLKGALI